MLQWSYLVSALSSSYLWLFRSLSPGTFPSGSPATAGYARRPCGPFCQSTIWRRRNSGTVQWDVPQHCLLRQFKASATSANQWKVDAPLHNQGCLESRVIKPLYTERRQPWQPVCVCACMCWRKKNPTPTLCFHVQQFLPLCFESVLWPHFSPWNRQFDSLYPSRDPLLFLAQCHWSVWPIRTNCFQIRHWAGKEVELGLAVWRGSINVNSCSTERMLHDTFFFFKSLKSWNKASTIIVKSWKSKSEIKIKMRVRKGAGGYQTSPVSFTSDSVACAANLRLASKTIISMKHVHVPVPQASTVGNKRI